MDHIRVPVWETGHHIGSEICEIETLEGGRYRLLHTPSVALGLARGDTISIGNAPEPTLSLCERGGQLGLWIFLPRESPDADLAVVIEQRLRAFGFDPDGKRHGLLVFSGPVGSGFGPSREP